jgi:hypothetical protein
MTYSGIKSISIVAIASLQQREDLSLRQEPTCVRRLLFTRRKAPLRFQHTCVDENQYLRLTSAYFRNKKGRDMLRIIPMLLLRLQFSACLRDRYFLLRA